MAETRVAQDREAKDRIFSFVTGSSRSLCVVLVLLLFFFRFRGLYPRKRIHQSGKWLASARGVNDFHIGAVADSCGEKNKRKKWMGGKGKSTGQEVDLCSFSRTMLEGMARFLWWTGNILAIFPLLNIFDGLFIFLKIHLITRVGTSTVATIFLELAQKRYILPRIL